MVLLVFFNEMYEVGFFLIFLKVILIVDDFLMNFLVLKLLNLVKLLILIFLIFLVNLIGKLFFVFFVLCFIL